MKRLTLLAAAFLASTPAFAATTVYGDAGSFGAAAGPIKTETFSNCGTSTVGVTGDLSSSSPGPCSSITAGVTFSPESGFNNYIAEPGQSANPTTALGVDFPRAGAMTIAFAAGSTAFAADMFQNFGGGSQSGSPADFFVNVFDSSNTLVNSFTFQIASGTGGFFGFTTDNAFSKVTVAQAGGFAVVDNVSFSDLSGVVPEPSTWAMMIFGFGAIGYGMRRKRGMVAGRFAIA